MITIPSLSRGVMLEGISCAGKTSTMYEIKKLFSYDKNLERNTIMLGEHYTQVLNSINGELVNHNHEEHTKMMYERVEMIEQLYKWSCYLGEFNRGSRGLYTVFERCFLNHIASYDDYDTIEMQNLAKRFEQLGIESVLLVISDDCLESRIQYRDYQMNITNPTISCKERAEQSKRMQDKLISTQKKLKIPSRIISTDSLQWGQYAKDIIGDTNNPIK